MPAKPRVDGHVADVILIRRKRPDAALQPQEPAESQEESRTQSAEERQAGGGILRRLLPSRVAKEYSGHVPVDPRDPGVLVTEERPSASGQTDERTRDSRAEDGREEVFRGLQDQRRAVRRVRRGGALDSRD